VIVGPVVLCTVVTHGLLLSVDHVTYYLLCTMSIVSAKYEVHVAAAAADLSH